MESQLCTQRRIHEAKEGNFSYRAAKVLPIIINHGRGLFLKIQNMQQFTADILGPIAWSLHSAIHRALR